MIEQNLLDPVIKVGNLKSKRTWSDVRDAVKAYYMLVTENPTAGEYYNIGGTFSCTVREMLDYLLSLSTVKNIKVEVDPDRLRPIDADLQVPDTKKFQAHTGWSPEIPFEKTLILEKLRITSKIDFWCRLVRVINFTTVNPPC